MRFECPESSAPADSLLGLVQRGRGAGWLAAVASPLPGRECLLECLTSDPRLDRQVESRAGFYGTLALALRVPASEVSGCGDLTDEDAWLLVDVLTEMAGRGDAGARELVASLPPDPHHPSPPSAPEDAAPNDPPGLPPVDAPVAALLAGDRVETRPAVLDRLRTTTAPLDVAALHAATQDPTLPGFLLAMRVLAERGDTSLITQVGQILAGDPSGLPRAGSLTYLRGLPAPAAVPVARDWLGLPDGRGDAAELLLAKHATVDDVPAIRARLADTADAHAQCALVDALARVPEAGPYPELREVFTDACYSYLRGRAARALAVTDPGFAHRFGAECLWDCETRTRGLGAEVAPTTPHVRVRLRELAHDEVEDPQVREAAQARLTALTG